MSTDAASDNAQLARTWVFGSADWATKITFQDFVFEPLHAVTRAVETVYEIEELYRVAIDAFHRFSQVILAASDWARFSPKVNHAESFKGRVEVNQVLVSLFTILRLYQESVRKIFSTDPDRVKHFFRMPGFWELDGLRNYVQHVALLPMKTDTQYDMCDGEVAMVSVRHRIDTGLMRTAELTNLSTRRDVESLLSRGEVDVYDVVMTGLSAFTLMHKILRSTKLFSVNYQKYCDYLKKLDALIVANGMVQYKIMQGNDVVGKGQPYFYSAQRLLVEEIRRTYEGDAIYPLDHLFPSVLPKDYVNKCKTAFLVGRWHEKAVDCHAHYEALQREYDISDIDAQDGVSGLEQADSLLVMLCNSASQKRNVSGEQCL